MTIVNKILNALIFLLAIAACVAAVLLYQRRIELRTRADLLAEAVAKNAEISDGSGETASELNASEKLKKENLDWKSFHLARDAQGNYDSWKENLSTVNERLEKLYAMKVELADALIKVSENLEYQKPDGIRSSLNSVNTYNAFIDEIHNQSGKIRTRDDRLASALAQLSKAIKKAQSEEDFKSLPDKNNLNQALENNISQLVNNAGHLLNRTQILAKGLTQLNAAFVEDPDGQMLFTPKWNAAAFNSESVEEINLAFADVYTDLKYLNSQLYKLKVANKQIDDQRSQIATKDAVIEELNNENDFLKNDNGRKKAAIARLEKKVEELNQLIPDYKGLVAKTVKAKISEVNDRFDFVVIDKGRAHGLVMNAKLLVHVDGRYICKVKVSSLQDGSAVCDILPSVAATRAETTASPSIPPIGAEAVTVND
ncbi:MAG: hypothetical protein NE327_05260 [Lentisphaeraceae bacterium]|nr:hypothetical protein [Lentisphaeraceae bacterium]